jgi:hypothetical protein
MDNAAWLVSIWFCIKLILYTYISITYYKLLISIFLTYKYTKSSHTCHLSLLKNNFKNLRIMSNHSMSCHISSLKNNFKNIKKSPDIMSSFSNKKIILKTIFEGRKKKNASSVREWGGLELSITQLLWDLSASQLRQQPFVSTKKIIV